MTSVKLPDYPALAALPALREALAMPGGRAVLAAPPGSGKTTVVPLALLDEPWLTAKKIVMLEPRRVAARASAARMASLLGEKSGETVGYQVRFERKIGPATRIEVITEGLLTRRLQADPELPGVGLVIFDEFHERSLDADLALALTLDAAASLNEALRVLVMSATLDTERVSALLGGAPIVTASGRMFRSTCVSRRHVRVRPPMLRWPKPVPPRSPNGMATCSPFCPAAGRFAAPSASSNRGSEPASSCIRCMAICRALSRIWHWRRTVMADAR